MKNHQFCIPGRELLLKDHAYLAVAGNVGLDIQLVTVEIGILTIVQNVVLRGDLVIGKGNVIVLIDGKFTGLLGNDAVGLHLVLQNIGTIIEIECDIVVLIVTDRNIQEVDVN